VARAIAIVRLTSRSIEAAEKSLEKEVALRVPLKIRSPRAFDAASFRL
jgi:hypothetical protein